MPERRILSGMRTLVLLLALTTAMTAQALQPALERPERGEMWWKLSAASVAMASAVDLHSSWGKCCESNALLASPDRRFSTRGAVIKSAGMAGQIYVQSLFRKQSPRMRTLFTILNFGGAAAMSMVAARNYGIPQIQPNRIR